MIAHGTRRGYDRDRCRCTLCRAVNADRVARNRAARFANPERLNHGHRSAYDAGCRCEACSLVRQSAYWREGGPRPHRWRESVTEAYRLAVYSWEARLESRHYMNWSADEFAEEIPRPPTFRSVLIGLAGSV